MALAKLQFSAGCLAALLSTAIPKEGLAMDASTQDLAQLVSGNTLVVANWFGPTLIHFYRNGKFRQLGQQGQTSEGVWRATDDSLCVTVTSLPPDRTPKEHCLELKGKSIGSKWMGGVDPRNGPISYSLVAGHPSFKEMQ